MWAFLALVLGLLGTAESGKRDGLLRSGRRTAASASSTSSAPSTSSRPPSNTNKVVVAVCPDNCSGHGRCIHVLVAPQDIVTNHSGGCKCFDGYSGVACASTVDVEV